jgi:hypothetical protein
MGNLVSEILLRLAKAGIVALLALVLYVIATAVLGEASSVALALLCWIAAAAFWLLIETSPL